MFYNICMNNNETIIEAKTLYFETVDGQHILPASLTKRSFARFIDFIMYGFIGNIFVIIFYQNISTDNLGQSFQFESYGAYFLVGMILIILCTFFFALIYPLYLNKKNPGQSLGKQIFNITPMYLGSKYHPTIDILKRETIVVGLYLFLNALVLATGFNYSSITALYNQYLLNIDSSNEIIYAWDFVVESPTLIGANNFQQTLGFIYLVVNPLFYFLLIILFMSIAFGTKKRGLHDKLANTAIVDLNTMGKVESIKTTSELDIEPIFENQEVINLSKWISEEFVYEEIIGDIVKEQIHLETIINKDDPSNNEKDLKNSTSENLNEKEEDIINSPKEKKLQEEKSDIKK